MAVIPDDVAVRTLVTVREEVLTEGGRADRGGPLVRAAAIAVIATPHARLGGMTKDEADAGAA